VTGARAPKISRTLGKAARQNAHLRCMDEALMLYKLGGDSYSQTFIPPPFKLSCIRSKSNRYQLTRQSILLASVTLHACTVRSSGAWVWYEADKDRAANNRRGFQPRRQITINTAVCSICIDPAVMLLSRWLKVHAQSERDWLCLRNIHGLYRLLHVLYSKWPYTAAAGKARRRLKWLRVESYEIKQYILKSFHSPQKELGPNSRDTKQGTW